MRKFMFTSEEIITNKSEKVKWHNFVRRREAEITFSLFPNERFQLGLELGAGDGGQSITLSQYCDKLICTEKDEYSHAWLGKTILNRKLSNVEYSLCDAQDLTQFADCTFDLVFSSNMLEHVPDVDLCLRECRRVLKDNGLMLHTMPSRWWKIFSAGLNIVKFRPPGIHGVSSNQLQEFKAFGVNTWKSRIESQGLKVAEIIGLPFYVGHGNSFIPIIKAGNLISLSASYLYVIRK